MAELSLAAQMRKKKAEGYTTGQVARLFGVTYYHAYSATVTHASDADTYVERTPRGGARVVPTPAGAHRSVSSPVASGPLSDAVLFERVADKSRRNLTLRVEATDELDRRYPDDGWREAFNTWRDEKIKAERAARRDTPVIVE